MRGLQERVLGGELPAPGPAKWVLALPAPLLALPAICACHLLAAAGQRRHAQTPPLPPPPLLPHAGNVLPPSDPEIMDWMLERMADQPSAPPATAPRGATQPPPLQHHQQQQQLPLNYNYGSEYQPDLGLFCAVDGAARLSRLLPSAALFSVSPPGSFYQVRAMGGGRAHGGAGGGG